MANSLHRNGIPKMEDSDRDRLLIQALGNDKYGCLLLYFPLGVEVKCEG